MKVLVTGGAGYIGSVVGTRLCEEGHDVVVLDDCSTGHADAVPDGARFVCARLHDVIGEVLAEGFDAVVHLAASSLVAESVAYPERYEENNVVGSTKLVKAMAEVGVDRIVFSSTAAVYGEPDRVPITEEAPCRPVNPYGASKLAVDRVLGRAANDGLAAVSLRYFNVAGAYGGRGERHVPETHLIPLALETALGRRAEMLIYGDDFPTPDGTCLRDYIHVADIADAHLAALEVARPGRHDIFNLGNGAGFSVREVLAVVEQVTGRPLPMRVVARRPGDPAVLVAAADRARLALGWQPRRPHLEQMIGDAWAFVTGRAK